MITEKSILEWVKPCDGKDSRGGNCQVGRQLNYDKGKKEFIEEDVIGGQ